MVRISVLFLKAALLVTCFVFLMGCWDRTEINDLAIVMASGFDIAEDDQIECTVQVALASGISKMQQSGGGAQGKKPVLLISQKGKDALDILNKMQEQMSRKIFLGHRGVTIIGEKYAKRGVDRVLDEHLRMPISRYNSIVLTTHGASAKEILKAKYSLELIPSIGMTKIQAHDTGVSIKISEYLDEISKSGTMPATGAIRLVKDENGELTFRIDEAAVYEKNKLVGFLPEHEMRMLQFWKGNGARINITVQAQPKKQKYKGTIGFKVERAAVKVKTKILNGKPEVTVKYKVTANVLENDTKLDLTKQMNLLNRLLKDEMHKEVSTMVSHVQKEMKSDIFGIGEKIHTQHPYYWKTIENDWETLFPDVPIAIEVEVNVIHLGRSQVPAHLEKKDMPPTK
ncbi:Ger(x)C family spore germination protein [Paenibacillus sp. GP183]|uniref:Ger(x)C family spore germination protein n=1 Tax=Paenibacillus sp. GP183 TaxID=1882751 RepID=UPI000894BA65|nr:Ger(x)C family spore germination protein [Paenibacillus sp. GP183]SEC79837.1 spore germination protein KC [Paenibacillus sp. GP183]